MGILVKLMAEENFDSVEDAPVETFDVIYFLFEMWHYCIKY